MSNSDLGERILKQTYRTEPGDPRQRELNQIAAELRRLRKRKQQLVEELATGLCEECGQPFTRIRSTRRYCSSACSQRASVKHRTNGAFDLALIESVWPLLRESGLLMPRVMAAVDQILHGKNAAEVSEMVRVSPQCISQYMVKADRSARLIKTIQQLVQVQRPPAEAS